jgi:hypothetical protein
MRWNILIALGVAVTIYAISDMATRHFSGLGLTERTKIIVINARAGCWPWTPAVVDYREGMTFCPGQKAIIRLSVPKPREPWI